MKSPKSVFITIPSEVIPSEIGTMLEQGRKLLKASRWQDARSIYDQVLSLVNKSPSLRALLIEVYSGLGIISEHQGRYDRAVFYYTEAAEIGRNAHLVKPEALSYMNLGHVFFHESRWKDATAQYEQALSLIEKLPEEAALQNMLRVSLLDIEASRGLVSNLREPEEDEEVSAETAIGQLRQKALGAISAQEWSEAEQYLRSAINKCESTHNYQLRAVLLNDLAYTLKHRDNIEEAKKAYMTAIEDSTRINDRKTMAISHNNLGLLLRDKGEYVSALQHYKESLRIKIEENDRGISNTLFNIARLYVEMKDYDAALEALNQAIERDKVEDKDQLKQDQELLTAINRARSDNPPLRN